MKVRLIKNHDAIGNSNKFNTSSPMCEVIVGWKDDLSDEYASDLEVLIKGKWMPLIEAFKNNDLITDNYNTEFFEPQNEDERKRGFRLTNRDLAELNASMADTAYSLSGD